VRSCSRRFAIAIRRMKSLNVNTDPLPPSVPLLSSHGRQCLPALWWQGWLRGTCFDTCWSQPSKPRNGAVADVERSTDVAERFPRLPPGPSFRNLMRCQLRLPPEPNSPRIALARLSPVLARIKLLSMEFQNSASTSVEALPRPAAPRVEKRTRHAVMSLPKAVACP
jgi:hypothetical protein